MTNIRYGFTLFASLTQPTKGPITLSRAAPLAVSKCSGGTLCPPYVSEGIPVTRVSNGMVLPSQNPQCALLVETMVIIPLVTAMSEGAWGLWFQFFVATSYLTQIDTRQRDLQLLDAQKHPN